MKKLTIFTALLFFSILIYSQNPKTGDLEIRVTGLRNANGKISVNLFNRADGFPEDPMKSFGWKTVKVVPDTVVIVFEELPYGNYAVSILHDENSNGKMEKNFLRIPREGFAFSNNYAPKISTPSFSEAMITLKQAKLKTDLKMLYY
jgi:uncharacterized protein (DUF2141 family)